MNTGEDTQGLRKIIDFTRLISIFILAIHFYIACFTVFEQWHLTADITTRIISNIAKTGLFNNIWKPKLAALLILFVSLVGAKGRKDEKIDKRVIVAYSLSGLLFYFVSQLAFYLYATATIITFTYIAVTTIGYLLILTGGTLLSRLIKVALTNDIFNTENETFPQEERLLENEYSVNPDKDKPDKFLVKNFESPNEALDFFKKQKGTSELAVGESVEAKQNLASMKDGKLNFVNPDFRQPYFSPMVSQTFYIKDGKGFSATQAANLVQDRTVLRTDLMTQNSQPYKAWMRLDFDVKKDNYGNHKFKQFHHPTYGFDLDKTLSNYKIKELAEPEKKAEIIKALSNGDRVAVTATGKDGKETKVMAEAVPRYGKLDFFSEKGAGLKREQFTKTATVANIQSQSKSQTQDKTQQQNQSRGIR